MHSGVGCDSGADGIQVIMPLTHKGNVLKEALQKEYGKARGESILYAGKNSGKFTGIDAAKLDAAVAGAEELSKVWSAVT